MSLLVDYCNERAARYAVEHWHYSQQLPAGNRFLVGAWEHARFIGCVVLSQGATHKLVAQWGLRPDEGCELTRVALDKHDAPVSQIVAAALRLLRERNPGLRLVVSFADPAQGHHGGIYQAGGWIYTGTSHPAAEFVVNGKQLHARSVHAKGWKQTIEWLQEHVDPNARKVYPPGKHRYLMPLDKAMCRRVLRYAQPYPHAVQGSEGAGSTP